jgi:hypothetical protein
MAVLATAINGGLFALAWFLSWLFMLPPLLINAAISARIHVWYLRYPEIYYARYVIPFIRVSDVPNKILRTKRPSLFFEWRFSEANVIPTQFMLDWLIFGRHKGPP